MARCSRRIGHFGITERNFDRFLRGLIIRTQIVHDALAAPGLAFARLVDNNRRIFGKSFAEAQGSKRRRINLLPEPVVRDRVRHLIEKFLVIDSQRQRRAADQRPARKSSGCRTRLAGQMIAQIG